MDLLEAVAAGDQRATEGLVRACRPTLVEAATFGINTGDRLNYRQCLGAECQQPFSTQRMWKRGWDSKSAAMAAIAWLFAAEALSLGDSPAPEAISYPSSAGSM